MPPAAQPSEIRDGRTRFVPNTGKLHDLKAPEEIARHCSILVTRWPPVESSFDEAGNHQPCGLAYGPASIAYFFYASRDDLSHVEGKTPVEWAKAYLEVSVSVTRRKGPEHPGNRKIDSAVCGNASERVWQAALSGALHGPEHLQPIWDALPAVLDDTHTIDVPTSPPVFWDVGSDPNDELYDGRAGFLHALRFIEQCVPAAAKQARAAIPQVIDAVLRRSPDSPKPWTFAEQYYLGLGHGWFAILAEVLLSDPSAERAAQIRPWLVRCINSQLPSGNWSKFVDQPDPKGEIVEVTDILVSYGHGAPGIVVAILSVRHIYAKHGDEEVVRMIDQTVEKAQSCIWERGFLTKESCILHGAAGNAMALTDRARQGTFLAHSFQEDIDAGIADGSLEASEPGSGLHKGLAGRIWCMIQYQKGKFGVFPGFNDF